MTSYLLRATGAFAVGAVALVCIGTSAQAYSDRVKQSCKGDYQSFCPNHPVGSTAMRRCMEANGPGISDRCVNALVDAGEISRKYRR